MKNNVVTNDYMNKANNKIPGQPYQKQWWMRYWDVEIENQSGQISKVKARFKKNRFIGTTYVFRFNCKPTGNRWNEPGYGWGIWEKL
jgi:hypothetical protein